MFLGDAAAAAGKESTFLRLLCCPLAKKRVICNLCLKETLMCKIYHKNVSNFTRVICMLAF